MDGQMVRPFLCIYRRNRPTDGRMDRRADGRTDRPSYGDAFLMDASKKSLRMFSDTIPVADGGTLDMHYRINDAHVDTFLHLSTMER